MRREAFWNYTKLLIHLCKVFLKKVIYIEIVFSFSIKLLCLLLFCYHFTLFVFWTVHNHIVSFAHYCCRSLNTRAAITVYFILCTLFGRNPYIVLSEKCQKIEKTGKHCFLKIKDTFKCLVLSDMGP